jgi:hypothetical protein
LFTTTHAQNGWSNGPRLPEALGAVGRHGLRLFFRLHHQDALAGARSAASFHWRRERLYGNKLPTQSIEKLAGGMHPERQNLNRSTTCMAANVGHCPTDSPVQDIGTATNLQPQEYTCAATPSSTTPSTSAGIADTCLRYSKAVSLTTKLDDDRSWLESHSTVRECRQHNGINASRCTHDAPETTGDAESLRLCPASPQRRRSRGYSGHAPAGHTHSPAVQVCRPRVQHSTVRDTGRHHKTH